MTNTAEKTNNGINTSSEKITTSKENELAEQIKSKIISILLGKNLLDLKQSLELNSFNDVKNYMNRLYQGKKISLDEYIEIGVKSGAMKLGNYLILKGYITKEILNEALKIQKNEGNKRNLGIILIEEKSLYKSKEEELTVEKLNEALNVLGIRKLGEYFAHLGLIKYNQINYYLEQQKLKSKPIGKLLVEEGIISQTKLNEILKDIGIKIKIDELSIDLENDGYNISSNDIWSVNYLK